MLWAPLLVLSSALNSAPVRAPLASTYDEAACDGSETPAPAPVEEARCSEPPPAAPAVIDCNDPLMSKWVGEMIGSCDMPKPAPPTGGPPVLHAARDTGATVRICDTFGCRHESAPLRPIGRELERPDPALATRVTLDPPAGDSALAERAAAIPSDPLPRRLERPPRV
jgi:hypothetical protein